MAPSSKASHIRARDSPQHKSAQFLQSGNFLVLGLTAGVPSDPWFVWRTSCASQCTLLLCPSPLPFPAFPPLAITFFADEIAKHN